MNYLDPKPPSRRSFLKDCLGAVAAAAAAPVAKAVSAAEGTRLRADILAEALHDLAPRLEKLFIQHRPFEVPQPIRTNQAAS